MTSLFEELTGDEDLDLRQQALDSLKPLYELKEQAKAYEKGIKLFDPSASDYGKMGALRRYLTDHPEEPLEDRELGYRARLRPGGRITYIEPAALIHLKNPELFRCLLELNLLDVNLARLKEAQEKGQVGPDMQKFMHEGERTPAMVIERI